MQFTSSSHFSLKNHSRILLPLSSDSMRFAAHPPLKHSPLSLIHFCALGFPFLLWHYLPILLVLHIYLLSTYNDRTLSPGSLDHTYHPHLYYLTAYVHVFAPDSLPHLFHAVFARFGPCSLYSLIVSYYLSLYMHDRDKSGPIVLPCACPCTSYHHSCQKKNVPAHWMLSNAVKPDRGTERVFRIRTLPA
jgi:hypothetical protein